MPTLHRPTSDLPTSPLPMNPAPRGAAKATQAARDGPCRRLSRGLALALACTLALQGCGGENDNRPAASSGRVLPQLQATAPVPEGPPPAGAVLPGADGQPGATSPLTRAMATALKAAGPLAAGGGSVAGVASAPLPAADPGLLLLLLPDEHRADDPRIAAWQDAAHEVGVRIAPVTDSAFRQLGAAALDYAGLVLPDDLHTVADDALIEAVRQYTQAGGQTLLSFDFGALTLIDGQPFYPVPRSRLSDLAGVDYVLYESLRERTTGIGPVVGRRSTLRSLLVPPGKSVPWQDGSTPALLQAAGADAGTALYLPVSPQDPGGARGFDVQQYSQQRYYSASGREGGATARTVKVNYGRAFRAETPSLRTLAAPEPLSLAAAPADDPLHAWHGYLLGPLLYPSFVTQGDFGQAPGQQVLASSPQFGLVAGVNPVGAGRVLFVNLPLTYLKGRTDGLMMHGFLRYFAHEMLGLAQLSAMPAGVGGLTYDWHLDAKAAQAPTQQLVKLKVFADPQALFSIEMTAGPDTIVPGDQLGWNLPKNKTAQQLLANFAKTGHAVGSHGGWIHDYYGSRVTEDNALQSSGGACVNTVLRVDNYLQCLVLNRQAVDSASKKPSRSYSAPEGNNPLWAMDWLEQQGVVGAYFAGHTGLGATRQWRDGQLRNPGLWVFPVTPQGVYATFEEFQDYGVPKAEVQAWYRELVDFSLAYNTSRLVYAHPPGAALWSDVLLDLLAYARAQGNRFAWYPMPRLADFLQQRLQVQWTQTRDAATGQTVLEANHPQSLAQMTWRLPRDRYPTAPVLLEGSASVDSSDARFWIVRASGGTRLRFRA